MFVQRLAGALSGTPTGIVIAPTDDELYLANIPGPADGTNTGHRWWSAERTFSTINADGFLEWGDRLKPGELLTRANVGGHANPTKTTAINSRQTLTFAGLSIMDSVELDADRNTIYVLHKPTTNASLHLLFGVADAASVGAPTDDVLSLGYTAGVPRLITDAGNATLAGTTASGDYRDVVHVVRVTMSPEHGKAIKINDGDEEIRNVALTTSLFDVSFRLAGFEGTASRYTGDIESLLILPGQDMSDPYFTAVDAEVIRILMARGGVA
jgi:hypothetical protein